MPPTEPTPEALRNPLLRYLLATRPAFLSATLCGWLIGIGTAHHAGVALDTGLAGLTLLFALVAHAGVNVLNDYYDARIGTDAINEGRIFPFTGGSRFIQNGVLGESETGRYGAALFATVMAAGLLLVARSGPATISISSFRVSWP